MTLPRRLVALPALLAVLVGCSLHVPQGVRLSRPLPPGQAGPGPIQVLPPGPQPDAPPDQVVSGFLDAQSDPDQRHAIARSFLATTRRGTWDDSAGVLVYDPSSRTVVQDDADPSRVVMSAALVGRIDRSGSYTAYEPGQVTVHEAYRLTREGSNWVIAELPQGLRLSPGDRDRSYRWRSVYFLGHSYGQTSDNPHLVADPVFVPVTGDPAQLLVQRLLAGWSAALGGGAVSTAVPSGTSLRRPVATSAGTVTVDLQAADCALSASAAERLSAQLVWTLRGVPAFARLSLLCNDRPVAVDGATAPQDRGTWADYDPDGLGGRAQAYYIDRRALRALDGAVTAGPASDGRQPVDVAAVSPGSSLALLTDEGGTTVLRTGSLRGPSYVERLRRPGLASPSWGSGEQGLWLLQTSGAAPAVLLLPNRADQPARQVAVVGAARIGTLRGLRVSRDGARIALIAGPAADPRLYVGRVEPRGPGGVEVAGIVAVGVGLHEVRDVAWDSATSLVALGRVGAIGPLPVRVAVDGSSVVRVVRQGLEQVAVESVAAAPQVPVVVSAVSAGQRRVYRDNGSVFAAQGPGRSPFYPG